MKSSKVTTRHIQQVARAPQVAQINLMRHQGTEFSASKHKKRKSFVWHRPPNPKNYTGDRQSNCKKSFDANNVYKNKEICQRCGDSNHIEGVHCPAKKFQCMSCHKYGHITSLWYQKKQASFRPRKSKAHLLQVGAVYACDNPYAAIQKIVHPVMSHSVCK